jgi:hypothetical protein
MTLINDGDRSTDGTQTLMIQILMAVADADELMHCQTVIMMERMEDSNPI